MKCPKQESSTQHPLSGVYDQQLQHLVRLAKQPGWKAYAWQRAKDLDREETGLFRGIAEDLKAAMAGQKPSTN